MSSKAKGHPSSLRSDATRGPCSLKIFPVGSGERQDHEVVYFNGVFIPVLGTVGGSKEESEQTARNIEQFLKTRRKS